MRCKGTAARRHGSVRLHKIELICFSGQRVFEVHATCTERRSESVEAHRTVLARESANRAEVHWAGCSYVVLGLGRHRQRRLPGDAAQYERRDLVRRLEPFARLGYDLSGLRTQQRRGRAVRVCQRRRRGFGSDSWIVRFWKDAAARSRSRLKRSAWDNASFWIGETQARLGSLRVDVRTKETRRVERPQSGRIGEWAQLDNQAHGVEAVGV